MTAKFQTWINLFSRNFSTVFQHENHDSDRNYIIMIIVIIVIITATYSTLNHMSTDRV